MADHEEIDTTLESAKAPAPDSPHKPDSPPKLTGSTWKLAFKRAAKEFTFDHGTDLAATLTYFTVLSLGPALLAIFSIISLVLSNNADVVTSLVDDFVKTSVPSDYQSFVADLIQTATGSTTGGIIALIVGTATALWSSSKYVKAFSRCVNTVYGREEGRGVIALTGTMLLTTFVMLVGIVLILISLALSQPLVDGLLSPIAEPLGISGAIDFMTSAFLPVWMWVKWPVVLILVVLLVAVLYYFTPNVKQPKFRWLSVGSIVAIVGIVLAGIALILYFTYASGYSSYGAIGTFMALLFALWVFNIVLLFGVEIDAEVERARELQAGIAAESEIQLPPRGITKVKKMKKAQNALEDQAIELRESRGEPEAKDDRNG